MITKELSRKRLQYYGMSFSRKMKKNLIIYLDWVQIEKSLRSAFGGNIKTIETTYTKITVLPGELVGTPTTLTLEQYLQLKNTLDRYVEKGKIINIKNVRICK
jgi:hypothetical protein